MGNIKRLRIAGSGRWRRPTWIAATLGAGVVGLGLVLPVASNADDVNGARTHLAALETQTNQLQTTFDLLSGQARRLGLPPASVGTTETGFVKVAQASRDVGALNVRLSQLEEQVRTLTGQVQGLQFQMTQMQTLIESMQADTDARLSALEGGKPGKSEATPPASGAMPSGGGSQPLDLTAPDQPDGASPMDDSQIVIDPKAEGYTLGTSPHPLGTLTLDQLDGGFSPDITEDTGKIVTDADAAAQYKAGYDAVVRGDYAFAEDQFRQFIGLFPDNPKAPDATNWLGEALIQRGEYDDAADILLNGYQSYPNSPLAPDILLKLGVALSGAGEQDTACRTFAEVTKRYPNQSAAFVRRLGVEKSKAGCV